jgi:hypothetical protein
MVEPAHRNVFFISSLARDKRIGCNRKHSLFMTGNRKNWEEWNVEFKGGGSVTVTSRAHGGETRFLAATKDGTVVTREHPFVWDMEESHHGGFHLIYISTDTLYYLKCDEKHTISLSLDGGTSESWLFEPRMPQTMTESQRNSMAIAAAGLVIMGLAPVAIMGAIGAMWFGVGGTSAGSMATGIGSTDDVGSRLNHRPFANWRNW